MVKVIVPNKSYSGFIAGVPFHNGIGEFQDEKLAKEIAEKFGFEVVTEPKEEQPAKEEVKEEKPSPKRKSKKVGE